MEVRNRFAILHPVEESFLNFAPLSSCAISNNPSRSETIQHRGLIRQRQCRSLQTCTFSRHRPFLRSLPRRLFPESASGFHRISVAIPLASHVRRLRHGNRCFCRTDSNKPRLIWSGMSIAIWTIPRAARNREKTDVEKNRMRVGSCVCGVDNISRQHQSHRTRS